jgi:vacuolar-type H+-ATPase subunit H
MTNKEAQDRPKREFQGQGDLRRLLEIEEKAQRVVRDAGERADEILAEAKQRAGGILGGTRSGVDRQAEALIKQARAETEAQAGQLLQEAEAETETMRRRAEKNLDEAVAHVVAWLTAER